MADYNVNMKQWNGTSFDNVLPLAYNAKQLEGQSLVDVKQWVQDNNLLLYTGKYTGTGTYGQSEPTTLTFPFEPILIFTPSISGQPTTVIPYFSLTSGTTYSMRMNGFSQTNPLKITASNDRKSLSYYNTTAEYQFNYRNSIYDFAAIGGYDMGGN